MLQSLNQEKCTWRLISSLYRDRLETEMNAGNDEPMMIDMLVITINKDILFHAIIKALNMLPDVIKLYQISHNMQKINCTFIHLK